ncbi:MAG: signal peptidase I, partial [Candidatus Aminicenantales bacterium]
KKDYVKRVIGLEGDRLEIRDKQVYINGQPLEEKYKVHIYGRLLLDGDNYGPVTVPAGNVFVMGDNRDNSADSRVWRFLPVDYIKGKPWIIYFSYQAEPEANLKTGLGDKLRRFLTFLPTARWSRLFRLIR